MKLTKQRKILGTAEMIIAAAIIICTVALSPAKADIPEATQTETSTAETTQAQTETQTDIQTADQYVPLPEQTTALPSSTNEYTIKNYIIVTEDSAMEMYSISKTKLSQYATVINTFASKVPDKKVYCLLAPTRIAFYGPDEYRTGSHSQPDGINYAYSCLSGNVTSVNAYSAISQHTDEYIYFRTDHHWTARGAFYAYTAFCGASGNSYHNLSDYETGRIDDFVGSMYRYTESENLLNHPDYVEYFMPIVPASGQYYSTPAMDDGKNLRIVSTNITDRSSKYMAFIQGDKPLIKMVTDNPNGKKILMIKESYGNAMAPFLLENYSEVYVLDPRQDGVSNMNLTQFVNDNGINEILFINYMMAPSNSKYMNALTTIVNM